VRSDSLANNLLGRQNAGGERKGIHWSEFIGRRFVLAELGARSHLVKVPLGSIPQGLNLVRFLGMVANAEAVGRNGRAP
jgi:hypothetical protein